MPAMLRDGIGFWSTLAACCALTFVLYLGTIAQKIRSNPCDIVMHCKKIFATRCATILTVSIFLPQKLHEWRTRYVSATALLTRPVQ
jgi:hypothetical protein